MWERPWPRSSNGCNAGLWPGATCSSPDHEVSPLRRVPFGSRPKRNQKVLPRHTARLRRVPSLHHCSVGSLRRAIPGPSQLSRHPCRSTHSTTIAFGLLERGVVPARIYCFDAGRCWLLFLTFVPTRSVGTIKSSLLLGCAYRPGDAVPGPVRRPSGGAVERGVWHGCQTRNDGPGMALRDDPRNSAGAREVWRSQTRMPGALSLCCP
ncbi:hypothetical protein FBY03_10349 [Pseudomonas sp. SJZ079]|nr:hypothetical protein FBY03_10349 [Pseudomonas sp. SJZ079]